MGSGYSVVDGKVEISNDCMQKLYAKYCDSSSYNAWKKQLEKAHNQQGLNHKTKDNSPKSVFM